MSRDWKKANSGMELGIGLLAEGFSFLIWTLVAVVVALVGVGGYLLYALFVAAPAAPIRVTPAVVAPAYSPVVPDVRPVIASHMGECFSTPMGDIGKVIGQDNEMLTMTFRGGVKSTYRFNQVTSSACGPAVVK